MNTNSEPCLTEDLRGHLAICQEVLSLVQLEHQGHGAGGPTGAPSRTLAKKSLLSKLTGSLNGLREHRIRWQRLSAQDRAQSPQVSSLLRQNQDLIMRIIVLDRENEQALLRKGLVPVRHLPPVERQRPHYVAELYRRQCRGAVSQAD